MSHWSYRSQGLTPRGSSQRHAGHSEHHLAGAVRHLDGHRLRGGRPDLLRPVFPRHHDPVRDRRLPDRGLRAVWPFGRSIERRPTSGVGSLIGNILWVIFLGWELALAHLITGALLCLTIIGIPLGLANFKIIPISLVPLGVRIVPSDR